MTPYPPHDTANWLRCPVYRDLSKKIEPLGAWTPNRALGIALGEGLAAFYQDRGNAPQVAQEALQRDFVEQAEWTFEGLERLLQRGLLKALAVAVATLETEDVVAVDQTMVVGRPDLVTRRKADRRLIVTDWKTVLSLDVRWMAKRLAEYDADWQFWQNAWEVGEHYGEECDLSRLHLTVLTPRAQSFFHPITVTPERVSFWLRGAEWAWEGMERERQGQANPAPNWFNCNGRYGRCEMYEACHTFHGNLEEACRVLYKQKGE